MDGLQDEVKTLAKGSFWQAVSAVVVRVLSLLYMVALARTFPEGDIGLFFFCLGVLSMLNLILDFGLASSLQRYIPYLASRRMFGEAKGLLEKAFLVGVGISLAAAAAFVLLPGQIAQAFNMPEAARVFPIFALYLVVAETFNLSQGFVMGRKLAKENAGGANIVNAAKLVLTMALAYALGAGIGSLVFGIVGAYVLGLAYSAAFSVREYGKIREAAGGDGPRESFFREFAVFGMALSAITALGSIMIYINTIMLGMLLPAEAAAAEIAVYSLAVSLAGFLYIFVAPVSSTFLPIISEMHGKGSKMEEMDSLAEEAVTWVVAASIPALAVFLLLPGEIINLLYGPAYAGGGIVLAVFSIGIFFSLISHIQRVIFVTFDQLGLEIKILGSALAINVILNIFLISQYGILGAALSSALVSAYMFAAEAYNLKKVGGINFPARAVAKYMCAGMASLAFSAALKYALDSLAPSQDFAAEMAVIVIVGAAYAALYLLFLILLKAFSKKNEAMFLAIMNKAGIPESMKRFGMSVFEKGVQGSEP